MNPQTDACKTDQELLDLMDKMSDQFERYVELNRLKDLSELIKSPNPIVHDWNTPLDIVWRKD